MHFDSTGPGIWSGAVHSVMAVVLEHSFCVLCEMNEYTTC